MIDVHDLQKHYGARKVVDGLTLGRRPARSAGSSAPTAAARRRRSACCAACIKPDGGGGTCLGLDIVRDAPLIRRQIGYMTQRFSFYEDLTVAENLDFVASVYEIHDRRTAVRTIIERMGLSNRENQLAGQLSGGWKQRLALAACVLHQPKLLLLDEPTAGVDAKARREFWDLIHDMAGEGLTVLVSTHYMDEAERCARIVYLAEGKIVVQGSPEDVVAGSGLVTFAGTGGDVDLVARRLRRMPGVEAAAVFGSAVHVAGPDRAALQRAIAALDGGGTLEWQEVKPRLEDVFIHLLSRSGSAAS